MRLAIISDLHADVHALRDALVQIERLGCDQIVCAGDVVDIGVFPQETLDLLIERRIPCIRGNHDRWSLGRGRADEPDADLDAPPRDATGWDLSSRALNFLAELPTSWNALIDGVRVTVWHASPGSDMDGIVPDDTSLTDAKRWLQQANADALIVGHTHQAFELRLPDGRLIANPGALLREPATAQAGAWLYDRGAGTFIRGAAPSGGTFGILELPSMQFSAHSAADGRRLDILKRALGVADSRASSRE